MKIKTSVRLMQGAAILAAALVITPIASAAPAPDSIQCPNYDGSMQTRRAQFHQERLNRLHDALKLTSAQQSAWQAYAKADAALPPMARPPRDADPVAMAQFRADRAAEMAQHLGAISKGTSTLWKVLTPEQRKTFEQLSMRGPWGHRGPMGGDRPQMPDQPPAPDAQ
jgi:periplasmic protein CpxP/Spy